MSDKERLKAIATQLWDGDWYLQTREWPDGTAEHIAILWKGRTDDGQHIIREKLYFEATNEPVLEVVEERPRGVVERISRRRGHENIRE